MCERFELLTQYGQKESDCFIKTYKITMGETTDNYQWTVEERKLMELIENY